MTKLAERLLKIFEMSYEDALKILNMKQGDDVTKAFKKASLKHHPDRGGSVEMMQKVNQAHDILKSSNNPNKQSFAQAKQDAFEKRKKNYAILQKIVEELVQKLSMALPDYQKHLEPFFNLKKPIIEPQLKEPKDAWDYDIAYIKVKFPSEDDKSYLQLTIDIWADNNVGGITTGEPSFIVSYDTVVYHNRKTHKMVKSRYTTGRVSSNDILIPEKVFPIKRLKTVLKSEAKKMSKKDFEAAIMIELKQYQPTWERYISAFVLNRQLENNIVMTLDRTTFRRQAAWNIMFRRKTQHGFSNPLVPNRDKDLPSNIKNMMFTLAENKTGLDLLLQFVDDVFKGKSVDNKYFEKSYSANEELEEKLASKILKCWKGYERVPNTKAGEKGSCKKIEERMVIIKPTKQNKELLKKRGLGSDDSRKFFNLYDAILSDREYSFIIGSDSKNDYLLKDIDKIGLKY
jgi:hypothetical protein